jgi:hypothetical protein
MSEFEKRISICFLNEISASLLVNQVDNTKTA